MALRIGAICNCMAWSRGCSTARPYLGEPGGESPPGHLITSADFAVHQSRRLSEVLQTCLATGRHSR
jgi:hypothetical protein